MKITIAHSPDADDAFMFYALAKGKIFTSDLQFVHVLKDIQTLNEEAAQEKYEVTAVSFAAYPKIADRYALLSSGASMGEKDYGPVLVARQNFPLEDLPHKRIAIPGSKTTAALAMKLAFPKAANIRVFPFNRILDVVKSGEAEAGLVIHEGQLIFSELGLVEIFNFGRWWWEKEQLPLPLGGNVLRRSLAPDLKKKIARYLKASIQYGLDHFDEALAYAMTFARDLPREKVAQFVKMYVNSRTLDYGEEGRQAVARLLEFAAQQGFSPKVELEFV